MKYSRAIQQQTGLERIFTERSEQTYRNMTRRMVRFGRPVSFTLAEFRAWLGELFHDNFNTAVQCEYCTRWLNVATFVIDHKDPLKFGGCSSLANLAVCCADCNHLKGAMSVEGFKRLLIFAELHLHAQDANEMFGRMKNGGAYIKLQFAQQHKTRKNAQDLVPFLSGPCL